MQFLSRFSPGRAYRDLRLFLGTRRPHELGFLVLAMAITGFFVYAFAHDSAVPVEYKPDIIYVEQWPLSRTDAEIRAQQKIDGAAKTKRLAEIKAAEDERRASFKRLDDRMKAYGL
jgi:hypothetical protein